MNGDLAALAKTQNFDTRTVPEITHVGKDYPDVRGIPTWSMRRSIWHESAATQPATLPASTQAASTQAAATQIAASRKAVPLNMDSRLQIHRDCP